MCNIWQECPFCNKSMTFGIADLSKSRDGCHFRKWVPGSPECVLCQKAIPEEPRYPADSINGRLQEFFRQSPRLQQDRFLANDYRCGPPNGMILVDQSLTAHNFFEQRSGTPCDDIADVPKKYTRQGVAQTPQSKDTCLFCDHQDSNDESIHVLFTFKLDAHVRIVH